MNVNDPRHGTYAGGRVHRASNEIPCEPCRRAEARYQNEILLDRMAGAPRAVASTGTRRRIQALVALGHSMARIAGALDISQQAAWNMANRPTAYTRRATAVRVANLYDSWSMRLPDMTPGAARKQALYARTVAKKRGFAPPLAWDDIDDPAEQPYGIRNGDEQTDRGGVIADVLDQGGNDWEVARRLGIGVLALEQWCDRNGMRAELNALRGRTKTDEGDAA